MRDFANVNQIISTLDAKKETFVISMLFVSFIGFMLIPLLTPIWWKNGMQQSAYNAILYVSGMHIGLTYFFYIDKDAAPVIRSQWFRFYVAAPGTILFFFLAFYLGSEAVRNLLWVIIGGWTIWHFQKQNFGIFILVNVARNDAPVHKAEKFAIYASGVAGILFNSIGYANGLAALGFAVISTPALLTGYMFQLASASALAWTLYRDRAAISLRHVFLMIFVFNWIMLSFVSWQVAFYTCAFGHGIQYMLMMSMIGANTSQLRFIGSLSMKNAPYIGIALVLLVGVGIFYLASHTNTLIPNDGELTPLGLGLTGLAFAITGVHYVLDAGIWRMRLPLPRQYMRQKLTFLFKKG